MGACYACFLNNLLILEDGKSDQVKGAESTSTLAVERLHDEV